MAAVGEPTQSGYAERVIGTIKEEEIDLSEYCDFDDALYARGRLIGVRLPARLLDEALNICDNDAS